MPDLFFSKSEQNDEITEMRKAVKKVWTQILPLQVALGDVKKMTFKEGESVQEEIELIEKQIEVLNKAQEDLINQKYSINAEKITLTNFQVERVLNNEVDTKCIYLLGKLSRDPTKRNAILVCRKPEFTDESVKKQFIKQAEQFFHNNEFRKFWIQAPKEIAQVQCELIYPASDKLIAKYTKQEKKVVRETAQLYKDIVKPLFIEPMDMAHCNWIYSILSGEKE